MTDLIERVRQRLCSIRHERVDANPQYVDRAQARAAVAEVFGWLVGEFADPPPPDLTELTSPGDKVGKV